MRILLTWCLFLFIIVSCGKGDKEATQKEIISTEEKIGESIKDNEPKTVAAFDDPEKNYLLVEQAVDAWLYFHLPDYKSYEPLIRSTEYDSLQNLYTHHLRLRMINSQGGPATEERTFKVDLTREGENGNPFYVEEVQ